MSMPVTDAILSRRSIRAFKPDALDPVALRQMIETAIWAPSGGNLQPWQLHAVTGQTLAQIKQAVTERAMANPLGDSHDYAIYPQPLTSPWRDRRFAAGETLYEALEISRDDKLGRLHQFLNNYQAFGAPCVIFFYVRRDHNSPQWADIGMLMQNLMLLAREQGWDSCAQESWSRFSSTIDPILGVTSDDMLFAGLALGVADPNAPINQAKPSRAPLNEVARFHD